MGACDERVWTALLAGGWQRGEPGGRSAKSLNYRSHRWWRVRCGRCRDRSQGRGGGRVLSFEETGCGLVGEFLGGFG